MIFIVLLAMQLVCICNKLTSWPVNITKHKKHLKNMPAPHFIRFVYSCAYDFNFGHPEYDVVLISYVTPFICVSHVAMCFWVMMGNCIFICISVQALLRRQGT